MNYESWRDVWERHGVAVGAAAAAVVGDSDAAALLIATVPDAIRDSDGVLDPLEALVAPLTAGRSSVERARAAGALVGLGIDATRAKAVTGARELAVASANPMVGGVPSFDEILRAMRPGQEPAEQTADEDRPTRWGQRVGAMSLVLFVVVASGAGMFRAIRGDRAGPLLIAAPPNPPAPWKLVAASAIQPVPMGPSEHLVQQFRGASGARLQIDIWGGDPQFEDAALGHVESTVVPERLSTRGTLLVGRDVFVIPNSALGYAHWNESGMLVRARAAGLSIDALRNVIGRLRPGNPFSESGYALIDPGWRSTTVPEQTVGLLEPTTTLSFRHGDPTDDELATVTATGWPRDPAVEERDRFIRDEFPARGVEFELRPGVTARKVIDLRYGSISWWDKRRRVLVDVSTRRCCTPPSENELVALAVSLRFVDAAEFALSVAPLQAEMRRGNALQRVRVGPLDLTYRLFNGPHHAASTVCTPTVCALWNDAEPGASSAELLIDGHWWHIERAGILGRAPTWRTSPIGGGLRLYESAAYGRQVWRAIDLGSDKTALRRNDDRNVFGRPIA